MNTLEDCCRAVCTAKGIDPDATGTGMGRDHPMGSTYKLWEYQIPFVETVMKILGTPD